MKDRIKAGFDGYGYLERSMIHSFHRFIRSIRSRLAEQKKKKRITRYIEHGRIPWSVGYHEYKIEQVTHKIAEGKWQDTLAPGFGIGLDERIVEYPWMLSRLSPSPSKLLDAGSILNHDFVLDNALLKQKEITICTYHPEPVSFNSQRISYQYGDLRELPFQDQWFDEVVCISTLEHIDKDNSMYGYTAAKSDRSDVKSYSYLDAVRELLRVMKPGGQLLITVPFGKFEDHGFFQQFDSEMLQRVKDLLGNHENLSLIFFKYSKMGWFTATKAECQEEESFNPHTGRGKGDDGAAHCRSIAAIQYIKRR